MDATTRSNAILQEIIDHHEIRKMLHIYCHGCDRADGLRMQSVYAENSWDDHGRYKGSGREFYKKVMESFSAGNKVTHLLGQTQIKVNGNLAGAETYFLAGVCAKDESGQDIITLLAGRYVDTLLREAAAWKIDKRLCVRDWSITLDVNQDRLKNSSFIQGEHSNDDPSYGVLGIVHQGLGI